MAEWRLSPLTPWQGGPPMTTSMSPALHHQAAIRSHLAGATVVNIALSAGCHDDSNTPCTTLLDYRRVQSQTESS